MNNIPPPALYEDILLHIAATSRKHIKDGNNLMGMAFLILDGKMQDVIAGVFENDDAKDGFAETVRQRASKTRPDAVVMVSEAWSLPDDTMNDPVKMAAHRKKYKEFADAPDRIDIVMLKLETREGQWMGRARITPYKDGRTFGAVKWLKAEDISGRFGKFLPIIYATPQQVQAFMDRVREKFQAAGMDPDMPLPSGVTLIGLLEKNMRQAPADSLTDDAINLSTEEIIAAWRQMYRP